MRAPATWAYYGDSPILCLLLRRLPRHLMRYYDIFDISWLPLAGHAQIFLLAPRSDAFSHSNKGPPGSHLSAP